MPFGSVDSLLATLRDLAGPMTFGALGGALVKIVHQRLPLPEALTSVFVALGLSYTLSEPLTQGLLWIAPALDHENTLVGVSTVLGISGFEGVKMVIRGLIGRFGGDQPSKDKGPNNGA